MTHLPSLLQDHNSPEYEALHRLVAGQASLVGDGPGPWLEPSVAFLSWSGWEPEPVLTVATGLWPGHQMLSILAPQMPRKVLAALNRDLHEFREQLDGRGRGSRVERFELMAPSDCHNYVEARLSAYKKAAS